MRRINLIPYCILMFTITACSRGNGDDNNPGNPVSWPSPAGDVVGKITVGYQGWFACKGDGSPIDAWWHWSNDWGMTPTPALSSIKSWPDVRDYQNTYVTE